MFHLRDVNPSNGPGSTEVMKPFGSDVQQKVFFAGKPKKKAPERTPCPGDYEPKKDFIKPKITGVSFT